MRSRPISARTPYALIEALEEYGHGMGTPGPAVNCALRAAVMLGLRCPVNRLVGVLGHDDQDKVDDVYLKVSQADPPPGPLEFVALSTARLGIDGMEGLHRDPEAPRRFVDYLLELYDSGKSGTDIMRELRSEDSC